MSPRLLTVEDYRRAARRKLPRVAFDNIDGAAETESSMRANLKAFADVGLRPRTGLRPGVPDLTTTLFGHNLSLPVLLAPCGMARVINPRGDLAGAAAAGRAATIFALSMMSGHAIEEVAAAGSGPIWFQVYAFGTREHSEQAIDRAAKAGFDALVVTLDTQVSPARLRDVRNGAKTLLGPRGLAQLRYSPQILRHPNWLIQRYRDGLVPRIPNVLRADGSAGYLWADGRPSSLTWDDFGWIRDRWDGPILAKGVLTGEDAVRAIECGVDAIIVSNHGGRQLDGTDATLRTLPEIVAAVAGRCPVLLDGGIRRGGDVIKAMSLGAAAVLIGRPWLFALGADGQRGVESLLELFRTDLTRDLQMMGVTRPGELGPSSVRVPKDWQ